MRAVASACLLLATAALAAEEPVRLGPAPPKPVRRVVTLAPSLTDTVLALGGRDLLVGVSRFDEQPEVAQLPRVGGFVDPNVEAVIALKPDLLLVQPAPGNKQPVEKLAALGVPVLALPLRSVASTRTALREVGLALGAEERASELIRDLDETRSRIQAKAKGRRPPRVVFIYGFSPLVVAGPGSFADELLSDAGAVNAAKGAASAYSVYSVESLIAANADLIIDSGAVMAPGAETLANLPALKRARWVKLSSKSLLQPGPRLARGLEELFALLHPEGAR